jgi:hypothetical protein
MIKTVAPWGKLGKRDDGSRGVNASFVHKHHGNVIPNGVNAAAGGTFEALLIASQLHRRFANRAYKNVEQVLGNRHSHLRGQL